MAQTRVRVFKAQRVPRQVPSRILTFHLAMWKTGDGLGDWFPRLIAENSKLLFLVSSAGFVRLYQTGLSLDEATFRLKRQLQEIRKIQTAHMDLAYLIKMFLCQKMNIAEYGTIRLMHNVLLLLATMEPRLQCLATEDSYNSTNT